MRHSTKDFNIRKHTKATKVSEIYTFEYLNFVLHSTLLRACFANFMVKCCAYLGAT